MSETVKPTLPENIAKLFPDKEVLLVSAGKQLEEVLRGNLSAVDFNDFIDNLGEVEIEFLTKKHPLLNQTPLSSIRQYVDKKLEEEKYKRKEIKHKKLTTRKITLPSKKSTRNEQNKYPQKLCVVAGADDLRYLNINTKVVHISAQKASSYAILKEILTRAPNLQRITCSPSHYDRLFSDTKKEFLERQNIEFVPLRIKDMEYYDNPVISNYDDKKQFFDKKIKNPDTNLRIKKMLEYEFEEAELSIEYFTGSKKSMRQISNEQGIPHVRVYRKISVFLHWLGYDKLHDASLPSKDYLDSKLEKLINSEKSEREYRKMREMYSIKGIYPPEDLPIGRWEIWHELMKLNLTNPEIFEKLEKKHPRSYKSLVYYFSLGEANRRTLSRIGKKYELSRERVRQLKNNALDFLGLLDE